VMGNGMLLVLAGLGLGVLGALAGGRVIQAQLYGVTPGDPVILVAVSGAVVLVALLASWLPARRAALVDPQAVLKGE
jgi:putative ABC transport system permease protein